MAKDNAPAEVVPVVAAIPPTHCDSQQPQENTSTSVEEVGKEDAEVSRHGSGNEDCEEEMLLGSSDLDDDLDDMASGVWERRRSGAIKGKRLLKIKEKVKAKQCKFVIVEDEKDFLPPAPPAGKQLADVHSGLRSVGSGSMYSHGQGAAIGPQTGGGVTQQMYAHRHRPRSCGVPLTRCLTCAKDHQSQHKIRNNACISKNPFVIYIYI